MTRGDPLVRRLHELAAFGPKRSGQVPRFIFLPRPDIEPVQAAVHVIALERGKSGTVDGEDAEPPAQPFGAGASGSQSRGRRFGGEIERAAGEVEALEQPGHGAVLERHHLVR